MLRRLVDDFRAGRPASDAGDDLYKAFALHKAVGTRPTLMPYTLPLDDAWLRRVAGQTTEDRRPSSEWIRGTAIESQDTDDVWVSREDLRPLDDACTKFVTRKFLPDAFARVNLVANVIRLYDRLAQLSKRPFRIVFKGGVMQRLVLLEFWHDMPGRVPAVEYLSQQKAVSISDMDFEILPDCHEKGKHSLVALNYLTLLWLQSQLVREIRTGTSGMLHVEWDRDVGAEELKVELQTAVDALDKTHPMHDATVDRVVVGGAVQTPPKGYVTRTGKSTPAPRRNLFVFACGGKTCVAPAADVFADMGVHPSLLPDARSSTLYATCNTYLNEGAVKQREDELRPLFHLARIKHTFVLYYTTKDGKRRCDRLAGELVDLSQGDPKDEGARDVHAKLGKGVRGNAYREYPILGVGGVALRSYTVAHFLLDHEHMLHRSSVPPWEVPKFQKRLVRYAAFLIAHVMSPDVRGTWDAKLEALHKLASYLGSPQLAAPLHTGCPPVDTFAARERRSLTSSREAQGYRRTLVGHLKTLVQLCSTTGAPSTHRLVGNHVWHTDHIDTR